jgi:hypothetical protein
MLHTTRHGAWWLRGGVLAAALAMLIPLATTASASMFPTGEGSLGADSFSSFEGGYVNDVTAIARTDDSDVFKAKFQLGTSDGFAVSAINRVDALTTYCSTDCNALAVGFQVVFTTMQDLKTIREVNLDNAQTGQCDSECSAVALGYQVVVASDTAEAPNWQGFTQMLSDAQLKALDQIGDEIDGLPQAGLTLDQIQSECGNLVGEVVEILQDPNYPAPASASPAVTPTPTGSAPPSFEQWTGNGLPTIDVYRGIQENLWPGWNGELTP